MGGSFLDPFLRYLLCVEIHHLRQGLGAGQVQACITDLRFLKMSLWWFVRCDKDDLGEENSENLKSLIRTFGCMWEKLVGVLEDILDESEDGNKIEELFPLKSLEIIVEDEAEEIREIAVDYEKYVEVEHKMYFSWYQRKAVKHWNVWSSQFEGTIEDCKVQISGYCSNLLNCTFNYSNSTPNADQILIFLDALLIKLMALPRCAMEGTQAVQLKNQMEILEEKRILLHAYFKLVPDDCLLELRDFREGLYDDINRVALLIFLYWAKAEDEDIAAELNLMLSDMSRKIIKPSVPDIASWYFGVLKAMQLQRPHDALLLGQAVPAFLDLLFEYMGFPLNADFLILRDGLVILFTFLANPPNDYAEDEEDLFLILDQIGDLLRQGSRLIPTVEDTKKVNVSNCVVKIEKLKGKIRKLHSCIPDSSLCNFPRTNGLGFMDCLLQNLKENLKNDKMFIPSAKHLIIKIEQELVSLRPDLDNIFELQKEHKELQEIWLQLINLAYLTEILVNLCYVVVYPVWYIIVCLADILHEVQVIKGKLDIIKDSDSYNATDFLKSLGSKAGIPTQAWYSGANERLVGCEEEVDMIVDQLIRGDKSLKIVSIVGMGGSGKTTLARKLYDNQQVKSRFKIFSFCTVSQVYSTRKLFLEVLKNSNSGFVYKESMTDDDLAQLLKRKLSDRSYLVVMDDIWEIDAWEKVKSAFPNYDNGSRVIFTTRELEVATKAKSKVHLKHLLTDKQSWELLKTEAFSQNDCPQDLFGIGQVIAKNCKGLPLSVAVIGRLLARNVRNLTLWNEIAENTTSFASEEGCMKVLELSYKHLPEHLKSCFLYVGVFGEDEFIRAKRLMLLWIAEGFVQKPETESVEIIAKEYLSELVDRSLLQVVKRSSNTIGIKTCQVHDVIRDFCQRKAHEENFFQLIHGATACNSSVSDQYRLSIHMGWGPFTDAEHRVLGTKSLLYNNIEEGFYSIPRESVWLKFQILQIMDLENVKLGGLRDKVYRMIECMVSLVCLRYLAIRLTLLSTIDIPSLVDLKNLETFIIRGAGRRDFWWRETFWRMDMLRHLKVGRYHLIPCPPKFEIYPPLCNLECFSTLMLEARTSEKILQRLPNLRKLSCVFNPDEDNESILALDVLTKLQSLKLKVVFGNVNKIFYVIFPENLKKLALRGEYLPSQQLGKLQHLEVLKIDGNHEERWDIEVGEFPMLKSLVLYDCELREWNVPHDSFPRLEQLVFSYCKYLSEIPASFAESSTLKKIEVVKCSSILASSAHEIRDEQEDLGNEIELIISDPLPDSSEEDPEDSE